MTTTHVVGINAGDLTPNGEKLSLPYFTMAGEAATSCDAVKNRAIAERNAKSKPVQAPLPASAQSGKSSMVRPVRRPS